ncbi:19366_t:CDS:2 [Racocetra persica]|uniref:19366_t:CDS:1 n=1 Tax=Racocetra persica TaxID=160502 RepID=A0ACA9M2I1_9GLOM|nr:19366_t:CDS:2 [Racocetra persica]
MIDSELNPQKIIGFLREELKWPIIHNKDGSIGDGKVGKPKKVKIKLETTTKQLEKMLENFEPQEEDKYFQIPQNKPSYSAYNNIPPQLLKVSKSEEGKIIGEEEKTLGQLEEERLLKGTPPPNLRKEREFRLELDNFIARNRKKYFKIFIFEKVPTAHEDTWIKQPFAEAVIGTTKSTREIMSYGVLKLTEKLIADDYREGKVNIVGTYQFAHESKFISMANRLKEGKNIEFSLIYKSAAGEKEFLTAPVERIIEKRPPREKVQREHKAEYQGMADKIIRMIRENQKRIKNE